MKRMFTRKTILFDFVRHFILESSLFHFSIIARKGYQTPNRTEFGTSIRIHLLDEKLKVGICNNIRTLEYILGSPSCTSTTQSRNTDLMGILLRSQSFLSHQRPRLSDQYQGLQGYFHTMDQ